ncbi:AMP-binding protein [Pseudonocardia xishanensis]|uniref:Acyl-CoA synthetase (AMP-forming)/AMP-acid ligase II n=1 Tax=Pseudonocardia xishanensis TaxID=630995 RepID=A0ABP8RGC0_9PSEU
MTPVLGGATLPAELAARVRGAAAELERRGIGPGDRVAIDGGDVLAWFLGADLRGAAALVVEPRWSARERAAVLGDARPLATVSGPVVGPVVGAVAGSDAGSVVGTVVSSGADGAAGADAEAPFYLATTSGSSGAPKVLQRSRRSWLRSFEALGRVPGPVLVAGPLSSSLFLFGALHALWCGAELRLAPRLTPDALRGIATVHVVPAMLPDLLGSDVDTIVCGGAHVPQALRRPGLVEYYGSAEHSLIAVRRDGALRPVPGVDLEVRAGELWVRSPLAVDGRLRAGVLDPAPEWTSVGDRVDIVDGALTVHGRGSATVLTGGLLVAAEEVEAVLRQVPGVLDVVVAGTPHPRLGAVVTAVVEGEPSLAALRAAAADGLEPRKRPRIWLRADEIPRTPAGKPARAALTAGLAAGGLDAEPLR